MRPRALHSFDSRRRGSPLNLYLGEIGSIPVLSRHAEIELGRRVRSGDRAAVDALVLHNLRFVVLIARRYARQSPIEDLIEEGNLGLIRAAERFDERYGFRFITYAVYWIRQSILRHLDGRTSLIRVPTRTKRQMAAVRRERARLPHLLEREPTPEEIAAVTGIQPERVVELRSLPTQPVSLDRPKEDSTHDFDLETLADPQAMAFEARALSELAAARVRAALLQLDARSADIIGSYWGLRGSVPESLECIGKRYGITRERARQLRDRGMLHLRRMLERDERQRLQAASHAALVDRSLATCACGEAESGRR